MRKWIVAAVIVAALGVAAAVVVANFNTYLNNNKDWLTAQVESALGREVDFDEIGVSLRGGLGVRVTNLRVVDDPKFHDGNIVRADNALVRVRVLPALFGRYEVARVVLEGPSVTIVRTADGLNVTAIGGGADEPAEPSETAALAIAFVTIDGGAIRYVDRTSEPPTEVAVDQLDFTASTVSLTEPVSFELAAAVLGSRKQNATLSGTVGPIGDAPDAAPIKIDLRVDPISTDDLARIPTVASMVPADLTTSGPVALTIAVDGNIGQAAVEARLDATEATVAYGETMKKPRGVPMRVDMRARRNEQTIDLERLDLEFHQARIEAAGKVTTGDSLAYDIDAKSQPIELRDWDRVVPALAGMSLRGTMALDLNIATPSSTGAGPAIKGTANLTGAGVRSAGMPTIDGLTTTATIAGEKVTVPDSQFRIGGAPATLSGTIDYSASPVITFKVNAAELPVAALGVDGGESSLPLRDVAVDGDVRMSETGAKIRAIAKSSSGRIQTFGYQDLVANMRLDESRVILDPVTCKAFGGELRGEGVYDMRNPDKPSFNFESRVRGLRVAQLAGAIAGPGSALLDGAMDADLRLAATGTDWDSISRGLVGGGRISVIEGVLKDVNLVDGVLEGMTGVPGLANLLSPDLRSKYPRLFQTGDTNFDLMTGDFSIVEGKLNSDRIEMKAKEFGIAAKGGIGLDRSVDLSARLDLVPALSKDLISQVSALRYLADNSGRVGIPFRLTGTLPAVRPQPDMRVVGQALQRATADRVVEKLLPGQAPTPDDSAGTGKAGEQKKAPPSTPPLEDQLQRGIEDLLGR